MYLGHFFRKPGLLHANRSSRKETTKTYLGNANARETTHNATAILSQYLPSGMLVIGKGLWRVRSCTTK